MGGCRRRARTQWVLDLGRRADRHVSDCGRDASVSWAATGTRSTPASWPPSGGLRWGRPTHATRLIQTAWRRRERSWAAIAAWVAARPLADVMSTLNEARVPAGPIARVSDIMASPQAAARQLFAKHAPPGGGPPATLPEFAPRLTGTPGRTTWAGPALGAHTDAVLAEVGFSEAEVARLRGEGCVV